MAKKTSSIKQLIAPKGMLFDKCFIKGDRAVMVMAEKRRSKR